MTNEDVDKIEGLLVEARKNVEGAGAALCGESGDVASGVRARIVKESGHIAETIHGLWKLRPEV